MKISDFELYRDILLRHSGLSLTQEKSYLLDSRLTPIARKSGYPTIEALTLALRGVPDGVLVHSVIESMMNTETSFFRDAGVFRIIQDSILPHIIKMRHRKKDLRILCAGCSTGQEPYSLAMMLKSMDSSLKGWGADILAVDISADAIRRARTGEYTQFEVQRGLPVQHLINYFQEMDAGWRLHDAVAGLVTFEQFNLLDPLDDLGLFDLILCRNVLTGFEPDTKTMIIKRMAEQLDEHGILILGEGETLAEADCPLRALPGFPGFYGHEGGKYQIDARQQAIA